VRSKLQGSVVSVLKQCFLIDAKLTDGFLRRLPSLRVLHTATAAVVHKYDIVFLKLVKFDFTN